MLRSNPNTGVNFGVDFGVDACIQTDDSQMKCEKCENSVTLINELREMLENIEKSIVYTQALEIDDNFIELVVKHLNSIDADLTVTNRISNNTEPLENMRNKSSTVRPLGTSYIPSLEDTSLLQMNRFHPLQHINNNTHFYQPPTKSQPSVTKPLP